MVRKWDFSKNMNLMKQTQSRPQVARRAVMNLSETKHSLITTDKQEVTTAAGTNRLSTANGPDAVADRIGNKITYRGVHSRGVFTVGSVPAIVRIALVNCRQGEAGFSALSGVAITSPFDLDKYTVLYDKIFAVEPNGPSSIPFSIRKKFHSKKRIGLRSQYSSTTTSDCSQNLLALVTVSDQAAGATAPHWTMDLQWFYKDL